MSNHPSRFDPDKKYAQVLYTSSDRHLHSHDANDAQTILGHRIKGIGDVLLNDGNVVRGGAVNVDPDSGLATIEEASVYVGGMVHEVEKQEFLIPIDRLVAIGLCMSEAIVTHEYDTELKGKIPGTRAFGEPGADRLQRQARWSWDGGECSGNFYAVYQVDHGIVVDKKPPPQFDPVNSALARYDREANGHYVVNGWQVIALGLENGFQSFSVLEGTINVWGNKITRDAALRIKQREDPDIHEIESEPHHIPADAGEQIEIGLNHGPIVSIVAATVLRERAVRLTHGAFSGVTDPLPDTSIAEIISIVQGDDAYRIDTDFIISRDGIDWSPSGDEPAPGSTYDVTYRYMDTVEPDDYSETGITLSGAVPGSTAIINYTYALPRIDVLAVSREGLVQYIKGQSIRHDPWPPSVPNDMVKLAEIVNRWGQTPEVQNIATHSVHYNQIENHGDLIDDLLDLVAQERLKRDMDARTVTAKRGVFVDPFLDDDMRDQGLEQTGAIIDEALRLPIEPTVSSVELGPDPFLLPYEEEVIIGQELATGCMKINPYQAFEPLPARVRISPSVDFWTVVRTRWTSAISRRFTRGRGILARTVRSQSTEQWRVDREEARNLRQRDVQFWIEGFGAGENLEKVTFDGVEITPRS